MSVWCEPVVEWTGSVHEWTVGFYVGEANRERFDLDAPCQRGAVWTVEQKRLLIRSLIGKYPTGLIVISEDDRADKCYRIIDGKQRILAMQEFVDGKFACPAIWFDKNANPEAWVNGVESKLLRWSTRVIPAKHFRSNMRWEADRREWVELTPKEQLTYEAEVFMLVNTGGVAQTSEHLAAVNAGARHG